MATVTDEAGNAKKDCISREYVLQCEKQEQMICRSIFLWGGMRVKTTGRIIAMLLVAALMIGLAACTGKPDAPAETTEDITTDAEPTLEAVAAGNSESAARAETTTEEIATTTEPETTTAAARTLRGQEALDLYNAAIKKAVNEKAGYQKRREIKITALNFGAFSRVPGLSAVVKDLVYGIFGVGSNGEGVYRQAVQKGQSTIYLRESKWTMNDVTSAVAEPDGSGGYHVKIAVKDGGTYWKGGGRGDAGSGNAVSPVDRGPLCYGADESEHHDHKTAQNLYYIINHMAHSLGTPSTQDIAERTGNVTMEGKIDSQGRIAHMKGYMEMTVDVNHVNFVVTLRNGSGRGHGTVEYSDFMY